MSGSAHFFGARMSESRPPGFSLGGNRAVLLWRSALREAPELATLVQGSIRSTSPVPIEML
jgi:hypothetical protein